MDHSFESELHARERAVGRRGQQCGPDDAGSQERGDPAWPAPPRVGPGHVLDGLLVQRAAARREDHEREAEHDRRSERHCACPRLCSLAQRSWLYTLFRLQKIWIIIIYYLFY